MIRFCAMGSEVGSSISVASVDTSRIADGDFVAELDDAPEVAGTEDEPDRIEFHINVRREDDELGFCEYMSLKNPAMPP